MSRSPPKPVKRRELHILAVLAESPLHGYALVKAVEERSGGTVMFDPANLYRLLGRMREEGWIQEQKVTAYTRRRTYEITRAGRRVLGDELKRMEQLIQQLKPATGRG